VSDVLPNIKSHLLEDADLTYSLIVREVGVGRDIEVLQFSLRNAIANQASKDNLQLKPLDKILIFSNKEITNSDHVSLNDFAVTEDVLLMKETEKQNETVSYFSRENLLKPIIQRLTSQSKSNYAIQVVQVDGAVKFPGAYPLTKNSKIKDLIIAAGGLAESAFLGNAELSRSNLTNNEYKQDLISVNLHNVLHDSSDNILLKSKDRLNINQIPYWKNEQRISLRGEFKFPGNYTIRRGETLSQLVERAGGFTEQANLDATLFTRTSLKKLESKNLQEVSDQLRREIATKSLSQTNSLAIDYQQVNQLLSDLTKVEPLGRLVIDLSALLAGDTSPIIMEDGDSVYVGSKQNTINVVGQVQLAGSHLYKERLSYEDYIKLSGGLKIQADEDRIYVIKANGAVETPETGNWFASNSKQIKPGDTVVVPLDTYFMEDITLWQTATQIIYQAAIGIAAIGSL
jgi:protein involved in polysaccharide export with SLBB domain